MPSLVEDVGTHFVGLASSHEILTNFGATQFAVNTNLFYIIEPASPNNCVTIIPYGGAPADTGHKKAQYPSFQIRVKADGVSKCYKTAQSVINELHQANNVGSDIPMKVFAVQSSPTFLGYDESDYPIFVTNFDAMLIKYTVS